jgi:hypothetical protein
LNPSGGRSCLHKGMGAPLELALVIECGASGANKEKWRKDKRGGGTASRADGNPSFLQAPAMRRSEVPGPRDACLTEAGSTGTFKG